MLAYPYGAVIIANRLLVTCTYMLCKAYCHVTCMMWWQQNPPKDTKWVWSAKSSNSASAEAWVYWGWLTGGHYKCHFLCCWLMSIQPDGNQESPLAEGSNAIYVVVVNLFMHPRWANFLRSFIWLLENFVIIKYARMKIFSKWLNLHVAFLIF